MKPQDNTKATNTRGMHLQEAPRPAAETALWEPDELWFWKNGEQGFLTCSEIISQVVFLCSWIYHFLLFGFFFWDSNLITFSAALSSLQTLPYSCLHSPSNSWSLFSVIVISRHRCICTYTYLNMSLFKVILQEQNWKDKIFKNKSIHLYEIHRYKMLK